MASPLSGALATAIGLAFLPACDDQPTIFEVIDLSAAADAGPDAAAPSDLSFPPADGSTPTIVVGAPDRLLLIGTIVTPDQIMDGEVLVEGTSITCAAAGTQCESETGAAGATIIDTHGIIAPGLIDTHNHILFDIFDEADWTPTQLYQNHNQWTAETGYQMMLDVKQCLSNDSQGKPAWCANTPYGTSAGSLRCELDKYGELKGLIAGTTSIVGLPGTSAACFGSLARSVDVSQNSGLGGDNVQTSSIFPPSKTSADGVCANFTSGATDAYLIHCGEGIDAASLAEFQTLKTVTTTAGCLIAPQTAITHGTAFGSAEFAAMAAGHVKLTWSPASNVFLYGNTADIPTARAAGVTIALAPDWSIGGSQNMLDELRFADAWDDAHWGNQLASKDLVLMATTNAAQAVGLADRLGQVKKGYLADLTVFAGNPAAPYDAVLAAQPRDVSLVMVGGVVLYGDPALQAAGPAQPGCEMLDVCGALKFLCVATTQASDKLNQTYGQIKGALDQAMIDVDAQTNGGVPHFAPLTPLVKCH
jgi:5-methylthioadenosine/S-adenosylhomocysteine deaminase